MQVTCNQDERRELSSCLTCRKSLSKGEKWIIKNENRYTLRTAKLIQFFLSNILSVWLMIDLCNKRCIERFAKIIMMLPHIPLYCIINHRLGYSAFFRYETRYFYSLTSIISKADIIVLAELSKHSKIWTNLWRNVYFCFGPKIEWKKITKNIIHIKIYCYIIILSNDTVFK